MSETPGPEAWGPLTQLIGEWEGEGGLDSAFSHSQGKALATPYQPIPHRGGLLALGRRNR